MRTLQLVLLMLGYITTNAERGTVEWTPAGSCCIALEAAVAAGHPIHQAMRAMTEAATGVPSAPAPVTGAK